MVMFPLFLFSISIHALTGSATRLYVGFFFFFIISIHALTGSATLALDTGVKLIDNFNPRTHGECDIVDECQVLWNARISIHALTGSATLALDTGVKLIDNFNPRTHGECDLDLYVGLVSRQNFNPRTRMGCDRYV